MSVPVLLQISSRFKGRIMHIHATWNRPLAAFVVTICSLIPAGYAQCSCNDGYLPQIITYGDPCSPGCESQFPITIQVIIFFFKDSIMPFDAKKKKNTWRSFLRQTTKIFISYIIYIFFIPKLVFLDTGERTTWLTG